MLKSNMNQNLVDFIWSNLFSYETWLLNDSASSQFIQLFAKYYIKASRGCIIGG